MTSDTQDLVGLHVYSRDGERVGKVKGVIRDPRGDVEDCLVIQYGLFRDVTVPLGAIGKRGEHVIVPLSRTFLDAC